VIAPSERRDTGPGALETALVLVLTLAIAAIILLFFEGWLAELVAMMVNAAHGGS
jgi:hypothetical protein